MPGVPKIELHEIFYKYQRHPDLLDLYVEGEFDRDVMEQFFREHRISANVTVFTADRVMMPNEVLVEMKLRLESNKHRLVGLAMLLERELANLPSNVTCIVDADQDRVLGAVQSIRHLAYTAHTCAETHCLGTETLHKFLVLSCNMNPGAVDEFLAIANAVLPTLFCLRALNEKLSLAARMPTLARALKTKNRLISFNCDAYINSFVELNKLYPEKAKIKAEFESLFQGLPADLRDKAHGHDFVELLFEYAAVAAKFQLHSKEHVHDFGGRLLMAAANHAELAADPLNIKLLDAAKGAQVMWP